MHWRVEKFFSLNTLKAEINYTYIKIVKVHFFNLFEKLKIKS